MINHDLKTFSPDFFNNYGELKTYFSGRKDLDEIKALAKNPIETHFPQSESGILKTLSKYPINFLFAPSLSILSKAVNGIGLKRLSYFFEIAAGHLSRDFHPKQIDGTPILVSAINLPKMDASDVYMCPEITYDSIADSRVRKCRDLPVGSAVVGYYVFSFYWQLFKICIRNGYFLQIPVIVAKAVATLARVFKKEFFATAGWGSNIEGNLLRSILKLKATYPWAVSEKPIVDLCHEVDEMYEGIQKPITPYKEDGSCRGASQWFIHLCLQSRKFFKDPEEWIKAVAQQFKEGIPGQGVILQSLYNSLYILDHCVNYSVKSHKIPHSELNKKSKTAIEKIKKLSPGIYETRVYHHALVYIKLENGESYTWDANAGLLKHNATQLLNYVINYYHKIDEPESEIMFRHHRLFQWIPQVF